MKRTGIVHEVAVTLRQGGVPAALLVRAALLRFGVMDADIVELESRGFHGLSVFFAQKRLASRLRSSFRGLGMKGVTVRQRVHRRSDWEARWKQSWRSFALTRNIQVIPLFVKKAACPRGKRPLYLDTTAAFGTGLHETTRFSAQLIEGVQGRFRSFLDVGTGTGILAIVARMHGAEYVEAFDIDPQAVKVARDNLKVNRLGCDVLKACDVNKYRPRRKFDLAAANLITHDLVAFRDRIVSFLDDNAHLIISGISLKNAALVKRTYNASAGLKCLRVVKGKEWVAFLFRKVSERSF